MVARRLLLALGVALVLSIIFTLTIMKRLGSSRPVEAANNRYVAASLDLNPGTVLNSTNLKMIDWPVATPLEGPFAKVEDLNGRTLLFPVAAGQPVLAKLVSAVGAGYGLQAKIPDGMRAISLRSDDIIGVSGFLLPGTHVDVLVTYHPIVNGVAQTNPITEIVLQNVQVLAAGQNTQPDPQGKATTTNVVTLLVSPEDAEKVTLATAQGTVQFVLRNGSDQEKIEQGLTKLGTFGAPQTPVKVDVPAVAAVKKPVIPPVKPPYVVQTVRGEKTSEEKF
ncbi:MAG TPA: Flp pilus assembly protein CpaB [Acidobacteriaceae bacterium]|jgi:pilus assembly protein CpaB